MCVHNKRLQDTIRVAVAYPGLAYLLLEQFGDPRGELAAVCRYFAQAVEYDPSRQDMLSDIATGELSHLEIIGPIVAVLSKGGKGQPAEAVESEAELYQSLSGGNDSHTTALLHGGGLTLTNSAGVPWAAAYIDTIGEPTADERSNIAAEARRKIVHERLIHQYDRRPGNRGVPRFADDPEFAHQKSFEKRCTGSGQVFRTASPRESQSSQQRLPQHVTANGRARTFERRRRLTVLGGKNEQSKSGRREATTQRDHKFHSRQTDWQQRPRTTRASRNHEWIE